ncbi:hypothetical protein T265_00898 [Opisthorchis viverrini]|uniref:Uncharacterized protein n=1 Tax=Opisthorchis viverrini TaxID=6198 RepID=A0A075ABL7_OPIVI|nr:hypothetical protein T265_00898 [Opisthorchis viverrini]KER33205.1 hypothetical protein T265_00898 [Opisthorchis viverrini]
MQYQDYCAEDGEVITLQSTVQKTHDTKRDGCRRLNSNHRLLTGLCELEKLSTENAQSCSELISMTENSAENVRWEHITKTFSSLRLLTGLCELEEPSTEHAPSCSELISMTGNSAENVR